MDLLYGVADAQTDAHDMDTVLESILKSGTQSFPVLVVGFLGSKAGIKLLPRTMSENEFELAVCLCFPQNNQQQLLTQE